MKGYKHFYTSTESEKGGALLYVNDQLNSKPRKDLDTLVYKCRQLESIFVEIINPGKKTYWLVVFIDIHQWIYMSLMKSS